MSIPSRPQMSEELIQRKLIADGHGYNEDKRLLNLFTNIHSLESNPTDVATMAKIEMTLAQAELAFEKQLIVADTCNRDANQIKEFMAQVGKLFFGFFVVTFCLAII